MKTYDVEIKATVTMSGIVCGIEANSSEEAEKQAMTMCHDVNMDIDWDSLKNHRVVGITEIKPGH